LRKENVMAESLRGHAQVELVKAGRTDGHRVPLGFWDASWDTFRGEDWHPKLFTAFRASMGALQRHQEGDVRANLHKSGGGPAPADEKQEARLLDREMSVLEAQAMDLPKIELDIITRRNALSPFKIAIDRQDIDAATQRAEQRALLRGMAPLDRLAALRGNVSETNAAAILSAPPSSSALSEEQWTNFREARLHALHPEKIASLTAAAAATKLVARTLDAARTSTRERYLPLLPAAPVEVKPINAPWVP
jgi:hypothetical protein